jgi:hypothetical protein
MLKLPNVTLIALSGIGYQNYENIAALSASSDGIEWGAVKYIQLGDITDINSWNKAVIYDLYKYVDTDFAMFVHGDGYVVNPSAWRDDFLAYDYIGAPWPLPRDDYSYKTPKGELVRVGNSVSLRSRKLLALPSQLNLEWKSYYGNTNEDGFLCVHNRKILEENGCKFAPLEVAIHFSREHSIPENDGIDTFAFHSL